MPEDFEELKIGKTVPNPKVHEGFSFIDRITELGHRLSNLRPAEEGDGLEAELILFDEVGDLADPQTVVLEEEHIAEARPFTMHFKDKRAVIGATAVTGVITVGSLILYRKVRKKD